LVDPFDVTLGTTGGMSRLRIHKIVGVEALDALASAMAVLEMEAKDRCGFGAAP